MDEAHLLACARYVELNPVRARLTKRAGLALVERAGDRIGRPLGSKTLIGGL